MLIPEITRSKKRPVPEEVVRDLENLCQTLSPGDRIPTHIELMRQFGASERTVLRALDDLQRTGRIVRRHGSGTFVAEPVAPIAPQSNVHHRTVVAITVPDNSFFDRCMDQLFRHAEAADLSLICRPAYPETKLASVLPSPGQGPFGFLLFQNMLAPLARELQDKGCRVVVVGAPLANEPLGVPCVYGDHEQGGYLATRHVLGLGHRRLLFAGIDERSFRWRGCHRAIRERERSGEAIQVTSIGLSGIEMWRQQPAAAETLFHATDGPTSVIVWNDHEAVKMVGILSRIGLRVPDDVSVSGYDALPEGDLIYPPLTTVDQAMDAQLRAALNLLTQPAPPSPTQTVIVMPTLIERESCAPPRP